MTPLEVGRKLEGDANLPFALTIRQAEDLGRAAITWANKERPQDAAAMNAQLERLDRAFRKARNPD